MRERLLRQPRSQEYLAMFELMDMLSSTDEEITRDAERKYG